MKINFLVNLSFAFVLIPTINSAKDLINPYEYQNYLQMAEMQVKLLQKVEEMTLYILQLESRIAAMESKEE